MRILVLSNGNFTEKDIPDTLEALQKEVGGLIDIPHMSDKLFRSGIDMIINDDGKGIEGINKEIAVLHDGKLVDIIYGNVVFAGYDAEGNNISLDEKQIDIVRQTFNKEVVMTIGEKLLILKVLEI